jgi:hypothetical protein
MSICSEGGQLTRTSETRATTVGPSTCTGTVLNCTCLHDITHDTRTSEFSASPPAVPRRGDERLTFSDSFNFLGTYVASCLSHLLL